MNLQIYVSGGIQKLFGLKAKEVTHESKLTLSPNWLEVWRCEHIFSDRENTHLCMFTNAATYYSILLTSHEPHNFATLLGDFQKLLMRDLQLASCAMPTSIQISSRLIKGNPRSLIGVMNQQAYQLDYWMEDGGSDIADIQIRLNDGLHTGLHGNPDYIVPREEYCKNIIQKPPFHKGTKVAGIGPDNVLPFLN